MRRRRYIRANFLPDDVDRVVTTDTAPYEVPIVFSNDGFYKNLRARHLGSAEKKETISAIIEQNEKNYTMPFRYSVVKTSTSFRQLSLPHPASQFRVSKFYGRYQDLICYYASRSPYSIRYPKSRGKRYFFRVSISDEHKYKSNHITTDDIDALVRNPASFFSYSGYDRLYRFFKSPDHVRLEKKYRIMHSVDVSKCFSSIYTHSIAWALKDIRTAKESTSAITFGNQFDTLMQKMNFNETNGICIGPEVSRIFAEIILGRVDQDVEASLEKKGLFNKKEYEIRRYVDDFLIFTNEHKHVETISKQISLCLSRFNLHVNEGKIETIERPFYTTKSKIVDDASKDINSFFESMLEKKSISGRELLEPKSIWKPNAVVRHFVNEIKSSCFDSNVGYDMVSSYVISAIEKRLDRVINDYDALGEEKPAAEKYVSIFVVLLEIMFFFYTVHATVAASFTLSKAIIKTSDFLRRVAPERLPYLGEKAAAWTTRLLQDPQIARIYEHHDAVPIEILNILIALKEVDQSGALEPESIEKILPNLQSADYFSTISVLYYMGANSKYDRIRDRIMKGAIRRLEKEDGVKKSSEMMHLALDLASCPYIPLPERGKVLRILRGEFQLPAMSSAALQSLSSEFEGEPWFVRWTGVDLLALIVKKELSAVY